MKYATIIMFHTNSDKHKIISKIESIVHKGEKRIKLIFGYDKELIAGVKEISGARWSNTMKCWHVPDNENSLTALKNLPIDSKATDVAELSVKRKETLKIGLGRYGKTDKIPCQKHSIQIERFSRWLKGQ